MLARPLCARGSLPLRALLRPFTITGLDLHLELELSLGRDFGADTLEVGAPPRRPPPSAPLEVTRPKPKVHFSVNTYFKSEVNPRDLIMM